MPLNGVKIWRDHLFDSFSSSPSSRPFRFKRRNGRLPTLTMLKMRPSTEMKPPTRRKKAHAAKPAKSSSKKLKNLASVANDSYESSMDDGEDTFTDDEKSDDGPPPPRTKRLRSAAQKASRSIGAVALSELEARAVQDSAQRLRSRVPSPPQSRKPPGSVEQLNRKKMVRIAEKNELGPSSMVLQTKDMKHGTLLDDWKSRRFTPEVVSFEFVEPIVEFHLSGLICG